jgi:hypothetical protein
MLTVGGIFEPARFAINDEGGWFAKPPRFCEVADDTFSLDIKT